MRRRRKCFAVRSSIQIHRYHRLLGLVPSLKNILPSPPMCCLLHPRRSMSTYATSTVAQTSLKRVVVAANMGPRSSVNYATRTAARIKLFEEVYARDTVQKSIRAIVVWVRGGVIPSVLSTDAPSKPRPVEFVSLMVPSSNAAHKMGAPTKPLRVACVLGTVLASNAVV